jgi:hypothetical protein
MAEMTAYLYGLVKSVAQIPLESARYALRNQSYEGQEFYEKRVYFDITEWDCGFEGMREIRKGEPSGIWLMPTRFAHPVTPNGCEGLGLSVIVISEGVRESQDWTKKALGEEAEVVVVPTGKPDFEMVGTITGHDLNETTDYDLLRLTDRIRGTISDYRSIHPLGRPERTETEMNDADMAAIAEAYGN